MKKTEKNVIVAELQEIFDNNSFVYITDASGMTAADTNKLRRELFKNGVTMRVAKNTLIKLAMKNSSKDFGELVDTLKGSSAIMVSENLKAPAVAIKSFRGSAESPKLKGAFIDSALFIGDNQLGALSTLQSKEDLIAEVVALLQSPIKNVLSAVQSSSQNITGILQTLSNKEN
ncbi:MAG: 50S ribosomal protein L10 [Bacteroidetes bacterium]|nr:50S ribosomal protein L10 [Bacteroidota bacterium]